MNEKRITCTTIIFPDLEKQLKELAVLDFDKFMLLAQIDKVQIFVCQEKSKGKSLQAIANTINAKGVKISKTSVHDRCKKCSDVPNGIKPA